MTKTLEMSGPARKTLASQIDRLDGILDGLSEGPSALSRCVPRTRPWRGPPIPARDVINPAARRPLQNPEIRAGRGRPAPPKTKQGSPAGCAASYQVGGRPAARDKGGGAEPPAHPTGP